MVLKCSEVGKVKDFTLVSVLQCCKELVVTFEEFVLMWDCCYRVKTLLMVNNLTEFKFQSKLKSFPN